MECVDSIGSYVCKCKSGFQSNGLDSCIDLNECFIGSDMCDQFADCTNTLGSYRELPIEANFNQLCI